MAKELPEKWIDTDLNTIIEFVIGGDWGKDPLKIQEEDFVEVSCIRGSEIKNWDKDKGTTASIRKIKKNSLEKRKLQEGDILLEISGGGPDQPVGRILYIDFESLKINNLPKVCTNFLRLVRINDSLNKRFIALYLHYFYLSGEVIKYQGGSNNLRNLKFKDYQKINIPLPPLSEQGRIVAKLDDLFARLDKIKASLAKIPELLKNFRQQVLTQAVTGKLTERMNGNSSVKLYSPITIEKLYTESPKNWKWINLTELAKLESGHTPRKSKPEYWENGNIPWISLQDIRQAHGKIISETKFMPNEEGIKNSSARLLPKGTVCFSRDISVGFTTIMGREMSTTQHFANWICDNDKLLNTYLLYAFMAAKNHLTSSGQGTTVKTIYMPALKKLHLLLPPIKEQQEIVKRVESLFIKADKIQEKYELLKAKIEQLPQAILHKAFKGELVPQLESDGNARELLKEIEELKAESLLKKASGRRNAIKDFGKEHTLNQESQLKVAEEKETYKE